MKGIFSKRRFDIDSDRLGPDCPFTHWRLYFKPCMTELAKKKFKYFGSGAEFRAGAYAVVCSKISIGDRVIIRPNTMLFADPRDGGAEVIIEDSVMIGSGVHIYTQNHRFDAVGVPIIDQGHSQSKDVRLCRGCWIGANVVILPGVTIGRNSVVGAGSIVTKSFGERVVVAGNPAKVVKVL